MFEPKHLPVYKMLVNRLKLGFNALDNHTQQQMIGFVKSQQHESGAFMDRAGYPDLYYSLFGLWLCMATEQKESLEKLAGYSKLKKTENPGPVEKLSLLLIRAELDQVLKRRSIVSLLKIFKDGGKSISLSYRFFLLTLAVDAVGKQRRFYYFLAKVALLFYRPSKGFPASLVAALAFSRQKVGLSPLKLLQQLLELANESGGFRAFEGVAHSDMLSTAVALFALRETASDLRILSPANLDFVQNNYAEGAFLSGDGDETRDLEYTFYGLLALGSLTSGRIDE